MDLAALLQMLARGGQGQNLGQAMAMQTPQVAPVGLPQMNGLGMMRQPQQMGGRPAPMGPANPASNMGKPTFLPDGSAWSPFSPPYQPPPPQSGGPNNKMPPYNPEHDLLFQIEQNKLAPFLRDNYAPGGSLMAKGGRNSGYGG